jgi:hypothetical protein
MSAGLVAIVLALAQSAEQEAVRAADRSKHWWARTRDYSMIAEFPHTHVDERPIVPAVDGLARRHPEIELCAAGWRFVAVPKFVARRGRSLARPSLDWEVRAWLAIPPEALALAARRFDQKRFAFAWAASVTPPVA